MSRSNERRQRRRGHALAMTGGRCWYCGADLAGALTLDHVTPRSRGGRNALFNIVPSCGPCNGAKGLRTLEEYRRAMGAGYLFWGERRAA